MKYLTSCVLLCCLQVISAFLELIILHTNDLHGRFEEISQHYRPCRGPMKKEKKCYGGFARLSYVIKQHRKEAETTPRRKVLYFDAGGVFLGTALFAMFKETICYELMNILKPDAMTLGNHAFDEGDERSGAYVRNLKSPVIITNKDFDEGILSEVQKSVVIQVEDMRFGIVGYLTPNTMYLSCPGDEIRFTDEFLAVQREATRLKEEGVHSVIAIGHSLLDVDKRIAEYVTDVDLIISGHGKSFLYNGKGPDCEKPEGKYPIVITQASGKQVPIVAAYHYGKYLGRLNTTFNYKGKLIDFVGQPMLMSQDVPEDPEVLDKIKTFRDKGQKEESEVVGKSNVYLQGNYEACYHRECNFGDLVADALIEHTVNQSKGYWSDISIALIGLRALTNDIDVSENGNNVTYGDLLASLAFNNYIITFSMTGEHLLQALEASVGDPRKGEFFQESGLYLGFDLRKPDGSKLIEAKARCSGCPVPVYKDIKKHQVYNIVGPKFFLSEHNKLSNLRRKVFNVKNIHKRMIEIVSDYIKKHSPIYPEMDERFYIHKKESTGPAFRANVVALIFLLLSTKILSTCSVDA